MNTLTMRDLSERWGISEAAVRKRRERGQLPEPDIRLGWNLAWHESTIEEFENGTTRTGSE